MPYSVAIVVKDSASPWLRRLPSNLRPGKINPTVGRAGVNVVRRHLFDFDNSHPNAMGGRRTHFYGNAVRSTNFRITGDGVLVAISHVGIAQRYFGGRIRPVNTKYLAVPARAEAHGRRPREFADLEPMIRWRGGKRRAVALVQRNASVLRKTRKGFARGRETGGGVMYWLVKSVRQNGDKSVLPTEAQLAAGITPHVDSYIKRIADREAARLTP